MNARPRPLATLLASHADDLVSAYQEGAEPARFEFCSDDEVSEFLAAVDADTRADLILDAVAESAKLQAALLTVLGPFTFDQIDGLREAASRALREAATSHARYLLERDRYIDDAFDEAGLSVSARELMRDAGVPAGEA